MDIRPSQNGRLFDNLRFSESGRPQVAPTKMAGTTESMNGSCRGELCSPSAPIQPATSIPLIRKRNRLQGYDYSQQGAYFITVCAQDRAELFGQIVGETCGRPLSNARPYTELSDLGQIVRDEIETLSRTYSTVIVDAFVIMPNHVHMILVIDGGRSQIAPTTTESMNDGCRGELCSTAAPSISRIIKQWKGAITKRNGFSPWQKSFHDHVIRNQDDYMRIAQYVENNPAQWELDSLHPKHP